MENKANLRTGSVNDETGKKRMEVVKWLNSLFPDLNLPLNATDEDLRSELFDGVILCAILNRKNLGSVQSQRGVFISSELRLYNVKRFLSAMDDMCLPKFNVSDLEQGYMSAVLDCLLSLKNRMNSSKGIDDGKCDAIKFGSLMFHKEILDVKQGKHIHSEPNSPLSVDERRRSFADNTLPSHMSGKSDVFQLKQGRYSDLNPDKLMDMMKSTSLDNAPTQSLLSVVNGILDESIERKNGEIPYRVTCLLRKAIQEIERRISTQADHIRSQNNLIKAREDKYQSRIKVLETLASGASDETQISYQLEKIKIGKTRPEENKNSNNQEMNKLMMEKENSENTISELKKELLNVKNLYESKTEDSKNNSNQEFDKLRKEKEDSDRMISELKKELENVKNQYKTRTEESKDNNSQEIDKLKKEKENSDNMISELKQELENAKNLYGSSDHKIFELKQELEKATTSYENSQSMIAELKCQLEKAKESYENRYQQLEKDSKNIKAQLEEKIKQSENLLEESKKRSKEIEESSEVNSQNWIRKEHIYQNFVGRQMQSVKNIKLTSESVKQEVRRTQDGWRDEITNLGEKLQVLVDAAQNYHAVLSENQRLYNEVLELKGNIRVYCRVRPFLPGQSGRATSVEYVGNDGEVVVVNPSKQGKDGRKMFKFTKGFGPASTQAEVYADIQPLVRSVLDGYNVCIFAYGQTGSGKTYTMNGPNSPTKEEYGVNYRALNDLFDISCNRSSTFTYEIGVQMVEIYNEQVRDLLTSDSSKKLGILNSAQPNGLAVPDASMLPVNSTSDVLDIMQFGFSNRAMSSTAMNERSSRSHSVVTIIVKCLDLKTGSTSQGCLHLIDLAGSERVDRSEVKGDRLKEAQHINKSLSALGDVIFALAQKSNHVPYRNSKLTQLLQSSLGGHAKTLMFIQVNPDAESYSETLSTLKFAERVSGVELGAARSNKEGKDVRDLMEQVNSLKETLAKKDDEIEELQLKSIKVGASSGAKTLKHSMSSPGIASPSKQFSPRLSSGKVAKFAERASSDQENSDISDRQSENSSQLSGENSEGRQSDTDVSNSLEKTKEKISKVSTRLTKPLLSKMGQGQTTTSIRSKLKVKSPPAMKKSTSSLTTTKTKPKTFK